MAMSAGKAALSSLSFLFASNNGKPQLQISMPVMRTLAPMALELRPAPTCPAPLDRWMLLAVHARAATASLTRMTPSAAWVSNGLQLPERQQQKPALQRVDADAVAP
jgi:hypothetical protein